MIDGCSCAWCPGAIGAQLCCLRAAPGCRAGTEQHAQGEKGAVLWLSLGLVSHERFLPVLVPHLAKHSFSLWNQWLAFNPARRVLWDTRAARAALEGGCFTGCTLPPSWYLKFTYMLFIILVLIYHRKWNGESIFYSLKWIAFSE